MCRWWYHLLRRGKPGEESDWIKSYKHELSSVCADFQMKMPGSGRQRIHSVEFREETGWRCQIKVPLPLKPWPSEEPSCEERTDKKKAISDLSPREQRFCDCIDKEKNGKLSSMFSFKTQQNFIELCFSSSSPWDTLWKRVLWTNQRVTCCTHSPPRDFQSTSVICVDKRLRNARTRQNLV